MSFPSQNPSIPQDRIGSYRITDTLGSGAMGLVYKAIQEPLGRMVALKVLPEHLSTDRQFCERFVREAKAAASVVDAHVVTCHDAGHADGKWYMALEFVSGGDADVLLKSAENGQLGVTHALAIIRDCARGLMAIDQAGLVHRDIKPANIFINEDGSAMLADLGLAFFTDGSDRLTQTGAIMGSPAYMAPEQARGESDLDIRADIYGLGASLFHLLCARPPFDAGTPLLTLQQLLSEPIPDPRSLNTTIDSDVSAVVHMALEKEREQRYQKPQDFLEDLEAVLTGRSLVHAQSTKKRVRAQHHQESMNRLQVPDELSSESIPEQASEKIVQPSAERGHLVEQFSGSSPSLKKFDPVKIKKMAQRIRTDENGLQAYLHLAPQASFPRQLLEAMLDILDISYGIDVGALMESSRPSDVARRIILASGDEPAPGYAGHSIYDTLIEALTVPIVVRVHADRMSAFALMLPDTLIDQQLVKQAIMQSGVRFGIDAEALQRLSEGPAEASGRLILARGQQGRQPRAAGFCLGQKVMNTTVDDMASAHMQKVFKGEIVATWEDQDKGETGMDVCGMAIQYPMPEQLSPDECVGEGVEIVRDRQGQLILKAISDGMCQKQSSGQIRVVEAMEIKGDLTLEHGPIKTNELLIVHGDVADDVEIESGGDVVIMGDLKNAHIRTSGSLIVDGAIAAGNREIIAAGCIEADSISIRRIMAGSVCIRGQVHNSDLVATGDITVDSVVGGRLCAGGNISALTVGDDHGITTELWAGHHLDYAEQKEMAQLEERGITVQRDRFMGQQKKIDQQIEHVEARKMRMQGAAFVKRGQAGQMDNELHVLVEQHQQVHQKAEDMRAELQQRRGNLHKLGTLKENSDAEISVRGVAHRGVIIKIANADSELLRSEENHMKRSMKSEE